MTGADPGHDEDLGPVQVWLLSRAIQADPDAPVNYVLRGQEWLAMGEWARAQTDFLTARALAEDLLQGSAWGYLYQMYIDWADLGLRQSGYDRSPQDGGWPYQTED